MFDLHAALLYFASVTVGLYGFRVHPSRFHSFLLLSKLQHMPLTCRVFVVFLSYPSWTTDLGLAAWGYDRFIVVAVNDNGNSYTAVALSPYILCHQCDKMSIAEFCK